MALLDLDNIIINRTLTGIRCTFCGGHLEMMITPSILGRFIQLVSFGTIKPQCYQCENCRKKFLFF
jgi:DNA-directed RNA polymerase subunit RPC12/RpoP